MIDISNDENMKKVKSDLEEAMGRQIDGIELEELANLFKLQSEFVKHCTDMSLDYAYESRKEVIESRAEIRKLKLDIGRLKIYSLIDSMLIAVLIIVLVCVLKVGGII